MVNHELMAPPPPPPPPPSDANMTDERKLYCLNALQVVGDWSVHDDGDGRLFYYDRNTDSSQWEVPDDLASLETEFMMKLMLQNAVARSGIWTAHDAGNGTLYYFNEKTRASAWERPTEWGEAEAAAAEERERERMAEVARKIREEEEQKLQKEKEAKKKREKKHKKNKKHKEKRDEEIEHKELEAQEEVEEEEPLTAEELQDQQERKAREQKSIEQFRAMLRDKNIMPFCKWSVALPQIAGDPRFVGVTTMDERRAIFEHFVEHRREDLKMEKKNKLKHAKQLFTQLLREQFQLDSWDPNTTLSVFLSTLETRVEDGRYKQIRDDALALLTLSAQEKIYAKAVAEYKSEALKRDGEQLRLSKFLEEKLSTRDESTMQWESDEVQKLVREFYDSAGAPGESGRLLSELKQKQVFEEVVARTTRGRASTQDDGSRKQQPECSNSRRQSPPRERAPSSDHKHQDSNPRRESRHSHHDRRRSRSRSRTRRRHSRGDSRSRSRERERGHHSRRSSRRRSTSSSRSRSSGRSSQRHRRHSSSASRSRSRTS